MLQDTRFEMVIVAGMCLKVSFTSIVSDEKSSTNALGGLSKSPKAKGVSSHLFSLIFVLMTTAFLLPSCVVD
jgi:hypothetical protein